jgi:hypothetical protein
LQKERIKMAQKRKFDRTPLIPSPEFPPTREDLVELFRNAGAALAAMLFDLRVNQNLKSEPAPPQPDLMSRRETAEHLRISVSLLDQLRRETDIPQIRLTDKKVLFSREAVDGWTKYNRPRIYRQRAEVADGSESKAVRRSPRRRSDVGQSE